MSNINGKMEKLFFARLDATKIAEKMGWLVEEFRFLTKNSLDDYLFVALCYNKANHENYVTWLYNDSTKGFNSGHYFAKYEDAYTNFNKRD